MSAYSVKSGKLSFKGDSTKKKKKKRKATDEGETLEESATAEGWINATELEHVHGPLFILFNSDPPCCLSVSESDMDTPTLSPLESDIMVAEPTNVHQVFVAGPFPGTTTNTFTLRTADGHFLATDKFGVVTCRREAAAGPEEWAAVRKEDGWAWQSVAYQKFLGVDQEFGSKPRCDSDTVGFCEIFRMRCQAGLVRKKKKEAKKEVAEADLEMDQLKRFQSWNSSRPTEVADSRSLRKAKKEGKLSEAMLDRREKLKADKFCK